jgi:hypothetical protein
MNWHTLIKSHLGAIAGAEFFTVQALRGFGLVCYYAFFALDIGSRRVHVAGITDQLSEAFASLLEWARSSTCTLWGRSLCVPRTQVGA